MEGANDRITKIVMEAALEDGGTASRKRGSTLLGETKELIN